MLDYCVLIDGFNGPFKMLCPFIDYMIDQRELLWTIMVESIVAIVVWTT